MSSVKLEDIFAALQSSVDVAPGEAKPLRAPMLGLDAEPSAKNEAFCEALRVLSTPDDEGALDEKGIDSFVRFFTALYDSGYRHMYSDICEVMFSYLGSGDDPDEESPTQSLSLANNIEIIAGAFERQVPDSLVTQSVIKLKDHIQLEQTRIKYMVKQNKWQRTSYEKATRTQQAAEATVDELKKKLEEATKQSKETLDAAKRDYVTILGIFASIVIAFTAGSAYTSSVLANINAIGVYRLVFLVLLIGLVLFNLLSLLLFFVSKVSHTDSDNMMSSVAKWGNVSIGAALSLVLIARYFQWV